MKHSKLLLIAIIGLFCLFCTGKNSKQVAGTNDFTLNSLDGEEYTLSKLKGKVLIVDFWATWCPPCRREIPHLIEIYDKYKEKGLLILGISTEDRSLLETFRRENNVNYPILMGTNEIFQKFGVKAIPHTLFIDKKGKIRKTQIGFADEFIPAFEAIIDTMINE